MTRLEAFRKATPDYPEDILEIRIHAPELAAYTDIEIQQMYRAYSEDCWAAGWICLSGEGIQDFRGYLQQETDDYTDMFS